MRWAQREMAVRVSGLRACGLGLEHGLEGFLSSVEPGTTADISEQPSAVGNPYHIEVTTSRAEYCLTRHWKSHHTQSKERKEQESDRPW